MDHRPYLLDEIERRVLGVLMEKAFTSAEGYPMTVNSVTVGCNQKSNRDPVMELDEDTVWDALSRLKDRGLVTRILPPPGSRADKFKHLVADKWGWQSQQRAVMTELLLRGPQTPGELRTRCERMTAFADLGAVMQTLESLMNWQPPLVAALPRAAGQSATRYTHLLYAEGPSASENTASRAGPQRGAAPSAVPHGNSDAPGHAAAPCDAMNAADLAGLPALVEELRSELAALRERVARLESELGV